MNTVEKSHSRSEATRATASRRRLRFWGFALAILAAGAIPGTAQADYLGSLSNRIFVDPSSFTEISDGYDNGDVIRFIMETTPRDTGSEKGHAAWMTVYLPDGVEVVDVDFVSPVAGFPSKPAENTDATYNGCGSRGCRSYSTTLAGATLGDGFQNEVMQDTGIFYSTDPRTQVQPLILPQLNTTGADTDPALIYNQWDYDQVEAFGIGAALSGNGGKGNAPLISLDGGTTWAGTASIVAGPDTYYTNDYNPACDCDGGACADPTEFAADIQCVGPWNRIQYPGSTLGGSGAIAPTAVSPGVILNTSVPTATGGTVSLGSPLPAATNAVRWVHKGRRLGDLEYGSITFRITDSAAFIADFFSDEFCLESTGGDTSDTAGKDVPWRYYEPARTTPCFSGRPEANLLKQFEFVNGAANTGQFLKTGDVVGFSVTFLNTTGGVISNVDMTDLPLENLTLIADPNSNALCPYTTYDGDLPGNLPSFSGIGGGNASWNTLASLGAGEQFTIHMCGTVAGVASGDLVRNRAVANYDVGVDSFVLQSDAQGTAADVALIAGQVRSDIDNDGDFADPEDGIEGVTINLYEDDGDGIFDAGDTLIATTTTASDGSYQFAGIDDGDYWVQEIDPASFSSTADIDTGFGLCGLSACNEIDVTVAGANSLGNDFLDTPIQADVTISKSDNNDPVFAGGTLTYTVLVSNLGGSTAENVEVVDVLDADTSYVSDTAGCVEAPVGTLTCDLGDIVGGGSTSFDVTVTVSGSAATAGVLQDSPCDASEDLCNNVTVSTTSTESNAGNNTADEPTNVEDPATVANVDKAVDLATAAAGDTLTYTLDPTYTGSVLLTDATLSDTIPTGTTYTAASASPAQTGGPDPLTWLLGSNTAAVPGADAGSAAVPVTVNLAPTDDTYIEEKNPNDTNGGATELKQKAKNNDDRRILLDFDVLGTVPAAATITDATLSIYVTKQKNDTVGVHRVTAAWTEGAATWNNINTSFDAVADATFDPSSSEDDYVDSDISSLVQEWVDGASTDFGVMFLSTADDEETKYRSKEQAGTNQDPVLSITYETAPAIPATTTSLTASPLLVPDGDDVTVTMTLTAAAAVTNATPGALVVVGTGGATALCVGPAPASADLVMPNFSADFTYTCTTTAGSLGGTLTFQGAGTGDGGVVFATGSSEGVISAPQISFQVDIDSPASVTEVDNTATLSDTGTIPPVPSNEVTTTIPSADLAITKTDGLVTADVGDTLTYTLVISNAGPDASGTGVTVSDTLPTDVTVNGGAAGAVTLGGANSGDWSCTSDGSAPQGIACTTTASIGSGGSSTFTFTVDALPNATAGQTLTNSTTVSPDPTIGDPDLTDNTDTDDTSVPLTADLSITKTDGLATALVGDTPTYTLVVSNAGPSASGTGVTVSDTLPTDVTVNSGAAGAVALGGANSGDWSCTSDALSPQGIACTTTASIGSGGSSTFTFTVDALPLATLGQTLTNSTTVTPDPTVTDPDPTNNDDTDDTSVPATADLSITKTDGLLTADVGDTPTYTLVISNAGPAGSGTGVTLTDTLPTNVTVNSGAAGAVALGGANSGDWSCTSNGLAPQGIACTTTASIGSGGSSTITFTVDALPASTAGTTLTNTTTVVADPVVTDTNPGNNTDTDNTTVPDNADLSITKTDGLATASVGDTPTYTLVISNAGPSASGTGVTLTDTLPADVTVNAGAAGAVALGGANSGDWSCISNALAPQSIACTTTASIASGGSSTITFTVDALPVATEGTTLTNATTVTPDPTVTDPDPTNNDDTDDTDVPLEADLSITKTDGLVTANVGDTPTYTLVVSNAGPSASGTGVTVSDTLPTDVTVNAGAAGAVALGGANSADWSCVSDALAPQGIACTTTVSIASAGSSTFTFTVDALPNATAGQTLTNSTVVAPDPNVTDTDPANNDDTDDTSVPETADLSITKTDGLATANVGDTPTYTLVISNAGPSASGTGVTLSDTLPTDVTVNAGAAGAVALGGANSGDWSCVSDALAPQGIACTTTASIASGGSSTITFTVDALPNATAGETLTNSTTVTPDPTVTDPDPTNNDDTDDTSVPGTADLSITKTDGLATANVGDTPTYTLVISNAGPTASGTGVTLSDTLPTDVTVNAGAAGAVALGGANSGDWSCVSDALAPQGIACTTTASIASGGSSTITFTVDALPNATAGETLTNSTTVTPDPTVVDPDPTNNDDTDDTSVPETADLSITKTDGLATANVGDTPTYTLVISNAGPSASGTGVTLSDTLPTDVTVNAGAAGAVALGGANSGDWSCVSDALAPQGIACTTTASIASGGSSTITFTVDALPNATAGQTLTNSTTVTPDPTVTDPDPTNNDDTDDTSVPGTADLSITKTDGLATANVGDTPTYTLVISNAGPTASGTGVTLSDTLPTDVTVNAGAAGAVALGGANSGDWSCVSDALAPQGIACTTTASIASGGSSTITFTVDALPNATAGETLTNSTTVTPDPTVVDPDPTNNDDTDDTSVPETADLSITKTDGLATAAVGDTPTYTLVISNAGPSASGTGVTLSDTLPTDVTVNAGAAGAVALGGANSGDWSCVSDALAPQGIACTTTASIASGGSSTITFTVDALPNATAGETLTNSTAVTPDPTVVDPDPTNNDDTDDTSVPETADLSITKTDGLATAAVGDTPTYTLVISNAGPSASGTGVTLSDTLPTDVTVNAGAAGAVALGGANSGDWSCVSDALAPQGIACTTTASIASGGSSTITFTVDALPNATAGQTLTNSTTVTPDPTVTDPDPTNNDDTDDTSVPETADLSITKTDGLVTANVGDVLTYTLVISNAGPSASGTGVTLSDTLPTDVTVNGGAAGAVALGGANSGDWSCVADALAPQGIACTTTASIASAGSSTITFAVDALPVATDGQTLTNNVTVTPDPTVTDPDPTNNDDDDDTTIGSAADLSIDKDDGVLVYTAGGALVYNIVVSNAGPSDVTAATVEDNFPGELTNITWTCSGTGAATCTAAGAGDISDSVDIPNGESVTYVVMVDVLASATADPLINVATVTAPLGVTDPTPGNNTDDDQDTPDPQADLSIDKDDGVVTYFPGDVLTYTIIVSNAGPSDVTGASVTDAFPGDIASATWVCAGSGAATCTAAGVGDIADLVDIPVGETVTYTVTATVSGAATADPLINVATVTEPVGTTDPTPGNNTDDDQDALGSGIDLVLVKTDSSGPVEAGAFLTYTLAITNDGPDPATGVSVTDTLDANTQFFLSTGGCVEAVPGVLTCDIGNLAVSETVTFDVIVYVDPAAPTVGPAPGTADCDGSEDLCNAAAVTGNEPEVDLTNNVDDAPTDVLVATSSSALSITKTQLDANPIPPGGTVTYQVVVTNPGVDDATGVLVHDQFDDAILTYSSDTGGCVLVASDTLACPVGALATGASVSIDITFDSAPTSPTGGTAGLVCDGNENTCNFAFASSTSPDPDPTDNVDDEPTVFGAGPLCGNGVIDPGEECDPPSNEICNDGIDNDGDLLIDGADPECVVPGFQSCNAGCLLTPALVPILDDPAKIVVYDPEKRAAGRKDFMKIHGRFNPTTIADPLTEGLTFRLSNANGEIYSASLLPGDMEAKIGRKSSRYRFKDKSARLPGVAPLREGIFQFTIRRKLVSGYVSYAFKVKCYGNMQRATLRRMTTQVYLGDDVAYLTADWSGPEGRWTLRPSDFKQD